MKRPRIWLLILLAILLPIRGAVAAGMLCEAPDAYAATASHSHQPANGHIPVHADVQPAQDATHDGTFVSHGTSFGDADSCNLCVVFCCSVTAMVSQVLTVPAPLDLASAPIPVFAAAAPSFVPDGFERPPRTI
ncbi:MAG: hypothetical protein EPN62_19730 [Candidimonas sp.]|nr:MAG: hypothetical protein EPN62_19730 [Candidimonas sp.]